MTKRRGMKAMVRSSRILWAVVAVPAFVVVGAFGAFGNWARCRIAEVTHPGVRLQPGVRLSNRGSLVIEGSLFAQRGVTIRVDDGGTLVFAGNNYLLRNSQVIVGAGQRVMVGNGTTIDRDVIIGGNVQIGANCLIAPRVFISSGRHQFKRNDGMTIRQQDALVDPNVGHVTVVIADDCWLGTNSVVLAGVRLGPGTVVGAGGVVTKPFPEPRQVLGGVPARILASE